MSREWATVGMEHPPLEVTTMSEQLPERSAAACLRAAVAAPSIHNTQPWRFRFDGAGFDVFADAGRALRVVDPAHRALHISVGAALCNLRLALAADGWTSRLEHPATGGALARVVAADRHEPSPSVRALALAIARRRTNRGPYDGDPVPVAVLEALRQAAATRDCRLVVLDPVRRGAVLALTQAADAWQRDDPQYRAELARWTTEHGDRRDGVVAPLFGPRPTSAALTLRDFGLGQPGAERDAARFEAHPNLVVLHSRGDGPGDWLDAGRALERVLLTAAIHGLAAQPMTQALEVAHLRRLLAAPGGRWYPQMILRVGYGHHVPASPRRPLHHVMLRSADAAAPEHSTAFARTAGGRAGLRYCR
ncbi:Acg family FMN-binding oxidoreductase [Dactylosporangium sp. CA-233914]|uniref:Acg family FMN-binding oxidoreductase n=1 Tax=Dactylosporangium sp. CA-233914 TaxID=3239934 RepID=UPI003D906AB0